MNALKKCLFGCFVAAFLLILASSSSLYTGIHKPESDGIEVTILYDNYIHTEGTRTGWGFSCLIEGTDKTILFDTGTKSEILWHNINKLNVDINQVDLVVLSHNHLDHTGGLDSVLDKNSNVSVYIPASFPETFFSRVKSKGAKVISVSDPVWICENVYSTGEMQGRANEQGLVLDTSKGLIVITGCAHPGIADIVNRAKDIHNTDVFFVLGGFHLLNASESQVMDIISQFRSAGVVKCGATHCTGDKQIRIFKREFAENYVGMGIGKIIKIEK